MTKVREYLEQLPVGEPISTSSLRRLASTDNIRQILSRLVKAGDLQRVARGVFIKPKSLPKVGNALPSATAIANTLAKSTGETITVHGAEAARQLRLTTQVPMQLVFYTSGNTRTLKIAHQTVKLMHVNPSRLIAANTMAGLAISALNYLGRKNATVETLNQIAKRMPAAEFEKMLNLVEQMPAWMANLIYHYQHKKQDE